MVSSSWFRRHQKTVYIVMIFAMFVWGISYSAMEMIPKKPIGKIFGRKITQNEFADMLGRWQRLFFSQSKESIVSLVWKQLLFVEKAKKMGILVTTQEIDEGLQRLAFQIFGENENINRPMLIQFLCNTFKLNQEQIVRTLREALLVEKLESLIRTSVKMTTDEAWLRYCLENEQVKLKVLTLKAKDFLDSVSVTEDEIRAYYEKYKNDEYDAGAEKPGYKLPERVKLECLVAKYDDMEKQISVTAEDMKKYYEDNKETQFKVTAEQKPADVAEDKGVTKNESATGNQSLKNEAEGPAAYKPFAEVKGEIQKTLARQKAMEKVAEIMNKLDEEIFETMDKAERPSFKDLAKKYKVMYEIPTGKKSHNEFLTEIDLLEVFPGSDQIVQVAFDREKNEASIPFNFIEGKVIFQVIDKKPSASAPLEEIRNVVVSDLKMEKCLLKANEIAEKYAGTSKRMSFKDIVKATRTETGKKDISVCETDYITRPMKLFNKDSRYIEALKEDRPNVAKKAFDLKSGQLGIALETSGEKACYIIGLVDRKSADKTAFEKDRENVTKRYLYEKQEDFMADWQNEVNQHMEIYTKFQ
ncbi:MAG: SurA N-terminal domain-containing protein [Candidatus Brocadia sp.]|nr:SurA N-terminal domain-containing protein [Candidatus Brocadia sp.]